MKTLNLKAGEKTRIIHKISNSLAVNYQFSVQPVTAGEKIVGKIEDEIEGEIEIAGSSWIFPKAPVRQELQANNIVAKGAWDTFYSVFVTPKHDVTVSLEGGSLNSRFFYLIAGIVILAILSSLIPFFLR